MLHAIGFLQWSWHFLSPAQYWFIESQSNIYTPEMWHGAVLIKNGNNNIREVQIYKVIEIESFKVNYEF